MAKLYMTELFKYQTDLQPPKSTQQTFNGMYIKPLWRYMVALLRTAAKFEISNCTDAELYNKEIKTLLTSKTKNRTFDTLSTRKDMAKNTHILLTAIG